MQSTSPDEQLRLPSQVSGSRSGTSGAEEPQLDHARPYRSRHTRPCDRCRRRKQRCVVLAGAARCLNCELGGCVCEFLLPAQVEKRPRAKKAHTLESNSPPQLADGQNAQAGPSSRPTAAAPAPRPPQPSASRPQAGPSCLRLPPAPSALDRLNVGVLLSAVTSANAAASSSPSSTSARPAASDYAFLQADYRALDLDAGEDTELYLVGTVAERDALTLSILATAATGAGDDAAGASASGGGGGGGGGVWIPAPGLRLRHVAPDAAFVRYSTKPYEEVAEQGSALIGLVSLIRSESAAGIMQSYLQNDGKAIPIWSQDHFEADPNINEGLQCALLATGLSYHPTLRGHIRQAWSITQTYFRTHGVRARLSTIQAGLLDLNGRFAVNPAGNFLTLNKLVAVAKLLGLNRDCARWTIPLWERQLRTRLWWALVQYDKLSAFAFGRQSMISDDEFDVPLPLPLADDSASYEAFLATCELSLVVGGLKRGWTVRDSPGRKLETISHLGIKLELWRREVDARGLFEGEKASAPGVRCLQLAYHYSVMALAGEALDAVSSASASVVAAGQRATLTAASELVTFLSSLDERAYRGFWSPHSSMFLSTCLTILVRLALHSDRDDQGDDAVWQGAVLTLRLLITALRDARTTYDWDIADLALSRAQFFVPLLQSQAPEFSVVLQPLETQFPEPPPVVDFQAFLASFEVDPFAGLSSDFVDLPPMHGSDLGSI